MPYGCGLSALPEDYNGIVVVISGDVPLLDADTLADLIATQQRRIGRRDRRSLPRCLIRPATAASCATQ